MKGENHMEYSIPTKTVEPHDDYQGDPGEFDPIRVMEIELSQPLPEIPAQDLQTGRIYRRGLGLVKLHDQPLGKVSLDLPDPGLTPQALGRRLWEELGDKIQEHLLVDGIISPSHLSPEGLPYNSIPPCLQERDKFLNSAPCASVVIATHNRTDSLAATLHSLLAMEYPSFEIILVDNAPNSNQTAEYIHQAYGGSEKIRYVREEYPGLSVAHNRGLMEVNTRYVAFTDDDVLVDRYWLTELMRGFQVCNRVACVTGMITPAELETPAQQLLEQYGGFSKGFTQQIFDLDTHQIRHPLYPFTAGWFGSGASMAFDTQFLKKLGGFDPATGAGTLAKGGDDLAAFFEVISAGYQLVYRPSAIVKHRHRPEYDGLRKQAYGYGVGLTAYLTKTLIDRPRRIISLALRLPSGLTYLLGPHSRKNANKHHGYRRELNYVEYLGMLYGPIAFLRSRKRAREAGLYAPKKSFSTRVDTTPDPLQQGCI